MRKKHLNCNQNGNKEDCDDNFYDNDDFTCDWGSLIAHCLQASQPSGKTPPPEKVWLLNFESYFLNLHSQLGGLHKIVWNVIPLRARINLYYQFVSVLIQVPWLTFQRTSQWCCVLRAGSCQLTFKMSDITWNFLLVLVDCE